MIRLLLSIVVTMTFGCSHAQEKFQNDIQARRCDEAMMHIPDRDPLIKIAKESKVAAGTMASYTFVGASYTSEVLWDITGGVVMAVGLCAPTIAAIVAANGGGYDTNPGMTCLPGKFSALQAPPLGRRAFENTKDMRCPELSDLSHALRDVSSCYESLGGAENKKKALENLEALRGSSDFYACLPESEQKLVSEQIDHLRVTSPE